MFILTFVKSLENGSNMLKTLKKNIQKGNCIAAIKDGLKLSQDYHYIESNMGI
jgi:hypothetical protein